MCNTRDVAKSAGVETGWSWPLGWNGAALFRVFARVAPEQHVASEFICWRERAQACVTCTVVPMVGFVLVDPGPTTESDSEMRCPASRAAAGTRQQTSTIVTRPIIFAVHPSHLCCSHRQRLQTAPRSAFSSSNARQASNVHVCTRLPGTLHPWGESGLAPWTSERPRVCCSVLQLFRFSLQFRKTILITVCLQRSVHNTRSSTADDVCFGRE